MPTCPECGYEMTEVDIGVYECHIPWCSRYLGGSEYGSRSGLSN